MGIGSLSIIAGIITTIYQFLKVSELNEGHRVAAVSWGKFHNNLKTLVLRHPLDRLSPNHAIKIYQHEYDHLQGRLFISHLTAALNDIHCLVQPLSEAEPVF